VSPKEGEALLRKELLLATDARIAQLELQLMREREKREN
jgi:hypothetical protein